MKNVINRIMKTLDNTDALNKEISDDYNKIDLPVDTQIRIALNTFSSEQLNDIRAKYNLNEYHWNILGLSYRNIGNYEMAELAYKNAIEQKNDYEEPYGNLLSLYIHLKKWESYEEIYKQALANSSSTSFIVYQDGRYQFLIGNFKLAYEAALTVLKQESMHNESAYILGVRALHKLAETDIIAERGKYLSEASLLLDRGLEIFPNSFELIKIKKANQF